MPDVKARIDDATPGRLEAIALSGIDKVVIEAATECLLLLSR